MFFQSLKTNIAINLALLLFVGMMLIAFVMTSTSQKELIRFELSKADIFAASIENNLQQAPKRKHVLVYPDTKKHFEKLLKTSNYSCLLLQEKTSDYSYCIGSNCALKEELEKIVQRSLIENKKIRKMAGTTWGALWKGSQHLLIAIPIVENGTPIASIGLVKDLKQIYGVLRRSQHLLFTYILVNTIILTLIGLYRLSRITVRPLKRLVSRAEDYREDDGMLFLYEKGENEFARLSKSLNRLYQRISMDKDKLQKTVTSLEKANIELKEAQKDIIKAEKLASVGRLSSGIAHEIGNPIGIIMGYLDLLRQNNLSSTEKHDFINRAESEIEKINGIIRQLLSYAKPTDEESKEVAVHEIIKEIEHVASIQPMMSDVELTLKLSADTDKVMGDSDQLRQVFLNLMINAVDAIHALDHPRVGEVIIASDVVRHKTPAAKDERAFLKITYRDNGIGIPEENMESIFDPFYTTKEPGKGTGLGLSVSFMIIEEMGGKLEATSKEGQGTTMSVFIPLSHDGK